MEEKIIEIRDYLPIYFETKENIEYIDYLTSAYIKNLEAKKYQFAFIAFHIFYMSFVYKTIWFLKNNGDNSKFKLIFDGCKYKNNLVMYTSLFDISVLGETESFKFCKIFGFHNNDIDIFSHPVEVRNHCSHASGKLHYSEKEIENFISKELEYTEKIQANSEPLLKKPFIDYLNDNWNPDVRKLRSAKEDLTENFIRKNLLSIKDIEYLTKLDLPEFNEKSNNQKTIYIKVLYLVLLLIAREFVEYEKNMFIEKLPILMDGFEDQKEISIETLVNDEFSLFIDSFSSEDKEKFEDITKIKLDQNI